MKKSENSRFFYAFYFKVLLLKALKKSPLKKPRIAAGLHQMNENLNVFL
jgi:hypothetical protein